MGQNRLWLTIAANGNECVEYRGLPRKHLLQHRQRFRGGARIEFTQAFDEADLSTVQT